MNASAMILAFGVCCAPNDGPPLVPAESRPAESVRRLADEFDPAPHAALEAGRRAKSEAERKAAERARPDRGTYARRFLDLAKDTGDEAVALDALIWVLRHGSGIPEGDEAFRTFAGRADRYARSEQ